eukprot:11221632-Lingulodinium_polyedra.AAC.1
MHGPPACWGACRGQVALSAEASSSPNASANRNGAAARGAPCAAGARAPGAQCSQPTGAAKPHRATGPGVTDQTEAPRRPEMEVARAPIAG